MEPLLPGTRGGEFRSLADALIPRLKPVPDLPDEDLLIGPDYARSAADLATELETATDVLRDDDHAENNGSRPSLDRAQRGAIRDRLPRMRRNLEVAYERERRAGARGRPPGCWCLGLGGKGSVGRAFGDPIDIAAGRTGNSAEMLMVDPVSGRALERAEVYCICSEGVARREREARRRLDWLSGYEAGREQAHVEKLWAQSGLPPMGEVYTLDQYPQRTSAQRATLKSVHMWRPPRWLFLFGDMRRGKTTLAQSLAVKALQRGIPVRFYRVSSLLDHLRAAISTDSSEAFMRQLQEIAFLVLDDIGASNATDFAADRLFVLLDERLKEQRTTIFTSNLHLGSGEDGLVRALAGSEPSPQRYIYAQRIDARIKQEADVIEVRGEPLSEPARRHEPIADW